MNTGEVVAGDPAAGQAFVTGDAVNVAARLDAELLAREGVQIIQRTDYLESQGDALGSLAHVLRTSGRDEEAAATLKEAIDRYEAKGNVVSAARAREALAELGAG